MYQPKLLKLNRKIFKTTALIITALIIISVFSFKDETKFINATTGVSELQNQYDKLEKEHQKIKNDLNNIANKKNSTEQQVTALKQEIDVTQQQIDLLNTKIDSFNNIITQKELEIATKEEEISTYYDAFKKRIRAMYVTDTGSVISMLLGSSDFSDFLTKSEFVKKTNLHDRELLKKLSADKKIIEEAKSSLENGKNEVLNSKTMINSKQNLLETKLGNSKQLVSELAVSEQQKKDQQQKLTNELNKINQEIERMIRESQIKNDFVGGAWGWPIQGYKNLTSYFGWRVINGINDFHTGIDIAGANIYGKDILAANDGVVSYVKNISSGYGRHLLVDHGGGNYTLYAHTSAILVMPGQNVKRGQVIARVGNTGWSSGPHLHFEIWINKERVNPLQFY